MNVQRERPPFSTITGTTVRFGERETVAIYRWDGLSWVAHFRDGCGEIQDAVSWFKAHASLLQSRGGCSSPALKTVEMLTPELISKIERLHRQRDAEDAARAQAWARTTAPLRRARQQVVATLQSWRSRLNRRTV